MTQQCLNEGAALNSYTNFLGVSTVSRWGDLLRRPMHLPSLCVKSVQERRSRDLLVDGGYILAISAGTNTTHILCFVPKSQSRRMEDLSECRRIRATSNKPGSIAAFLARVIGKKLLRLPERSRACSDTFPDASNSELER